MTLLKDALPVCRCTAVMLSKLSEVLGPETPTALPLLCDKLRSDGTRYAAVNACKEIAAAQPQLPLQPFVPELVTQMTPFLRKAHRGLRYATLSALASLLENHAGAASGSSTIDSQLLEALLTEAAPLISDKDLLLAAASLQMCEAATRVRHMLLLLLLLLLPCAIARSSIYAASSEYRRTAKHCWVLEVCLSGV